jgi:hypothetical protein
MDAITASTPSVMGMLPNIIPDEKTTATILNRYLELALKEIDNVERTTETMTLDGLSQEATKLTVKIYEQDALDAAKAILKAAKTDTDIKKVVEDFGDFYNDMMAEMNAEYDIDYEDVDAYAEFTKLIDEALNQLPAEAEDTENAISLTLYVDDNHNVIGFNLTLPDQAEAIVNFYFVTEGNNFKTVVEMAEVMKVTGSGTINNGKIDGTFAFTADGITGLTIELKNFDTNNKDAVSGTMIIKPTKDLLSQMDGIDELPFDDIGLQLDLDITADKYDVTLKLIGDDAMVVGLALKLATKTPGNIKAPNNAVDVTDQQAFMNWVAGIDFDEIIDNLEDAGVPDSLLTALESLVPAM